MYFLTVEFFICSRYNIHCHTTSATRIVTVKNELAVTSIKQPTCLKQPNKMFPNIMFVLKFTSVKQPPVLSSHFCPFFVWLLNTGLTV